MLLAIKKAPERLWSFFVFFFDLLFTGNKLEKIMKNLTFWAR